MEIIKVAEKIFGTYQLHLFSVMLYYAYMQFKINKRLEVQVARCEGRFDVINYRMEDIEKENTNPQ